MVFGTTSFFYFFQMLNNLPRLVMFIWESSTFLTSHQAVIDVYPQSSSLRLHDNRLINSVDEFDQYYGVVVFSACNISLPLNVTFHWNHYFEGTSVHTEQSHNCQTTLHCVQDGQYTVHLSVTSEQGDVISSGSQTYEARTSWVAIIGDSFASGEGTPDVPKHGDREAQWIDERCHRSSKSFASIVFKELASATPTYLTFLACTGATIENGILEANGHASQLDTLKSISTRRGRGPDIVILTTGGNDIGFSDIINALVHDSARFDVSLIDMRFFFVSHQLDLVAKRLAALGARNVFVPQYFDFTKNQHGEVDADCIASKERILRRLNMLLLKKGLEHGWHVTTRVPSLFAQRGICSSRSYIRSRLESTAVQGNTMGAFHPNEAGHKAVSSEMLKLMRTSGALLGS